MRGSTLWYLQRASALVITWCSAGCLAILVWANRPLQDAQGLRELIFSFSVGWLFALALGMMYFHGLLGIYVVVTDYIHHKTLRGVMVVWGFIWAIIGCAGMMLWLL